MKVAVIGSGTMGSGIVQILCECNEVDQVIWRGSCDTRLDASFTSLKSNWDRLEKKKRIVEGDKESFINKVCLTSSFEEMNGSQFIIEAVAENLKKKEDIFTAVDKYVSDYTVLATNTSSLSITALASKVANPEKVIGLHFFNPAPVMKLTEVIIGLATSQKTIDESFRLSYMLKKEPVKVNEAPGFIVNRMLIPMINEAVGILAEAVASAKEIDNAMKLGANHPIGPLALSDLIGNDVVLSIMESLYVETGDQKYRAHPLLRKIVRAGNLGRKSKVGFYEY